MEMENFSTPKIGSSSARHPINEPQEPHRFLRVRAIIVVFGLLFLFGTIPSSLLSQQSSDSPDERSDTEEESEKASIQRWTDQLSSEKRPERQEAARKLVRSGSDQRLDIIVRLLNSGTKKEQDALLTGIANGVSAEEKAVDHLLKPILRRYAQTTNDKGSALIEAASYFPSQKLQTAIQSLLTQETLNGGIPRSVRMLQKARLLQLLGSEQIETDPFHTGTLLIDLLDTLPEELHSDVVSAFQKTFSIYSITTVEECRQWWNKHSSKKPDKLYRLIAVRANKQGFRDWKQVVKKLFKAHGTGSAKVYADLLDTPDPRKLQFLLEQIRKIPPEEDRSLLGKQLSELLSRDLQAKVQLDALNTIEQLELTSAREEVEKLLFSFRPSIRSAVASALGKIGNASSGERLTEQFRIERTSHVTKSIVKALQDLKHTDAIPMLKKRLLRKGSHEKEVRSAIVQALGTLGSKDSLSALTTFLNDTDPKTDKDLRFDLAYSIGQIQHPKGVKTLVRLTNDPNPSVRGGAAQALGNIQFSNRDLPDIVTLQQKALDALFQLLKSEDEDTTIRRRAISSISSIGTASSIKRLLKLIGEQEDSTQSYIREALVSLLSKHPDQILNTIETLQNKNLHALVNHLNDKIDPEKMKQLNDGTSARVRLLFARSHLARKDWSAVITQLKNLDEVPGVKNKQIRLMRIEAYIGLENFSEAQKLLTSLQENAEEGSALWWEIQVLNVKLNIKKPPPSTAVSLIQELLQRTPPSEIGAELKRIRKKHKNNVRKIDRHLEKLTNTNDPDAVQEEMETLLNLHPYHTRIVKKSLADIPSDPTQAKRYMTPPLAQVLSQITGRKLSFDEKTTPEQVQNARSEWATWLKNHTTSSDEAENGS